MIKRQWLSRHVTWIIKKKFCIVGNKLISFLENMEFKKWNLTSNPKQKREEENDSWIMKTSESNGLSFAIPNTIHIKFMLLRHILFKFFIRRPYVGESLSYERFCSIENNIFLQDWTDHDYYESVLKVYWNVIFTLNMWRIRTIRVPCGRVSTAICK